MQKFFASLMVVVFILSHVPYVMGQTDGRLEIAAHLESFGVELQTIFITEGEEAAWNAFNHDVVQRFEKAYQESLIRISQLPRHDIDRIVDQLSSMNIQDEEFQMILYDRSLSNREKFQSLFQYVYQIGVKGGLHKLKESIKQVGFEKAFSNQANRLRGRDYEGKENFWSGLGTLVVVSLMVGAFVASWSGGEAYTLRAVLNASAATFAAIVIVGLIVWATSPE